MLDQLDAKIDRRLVRTFVRTIDAILCFRNRPHGLLLSALGDYLLSSEHAAAGTKRLSNLLRSAKWSLALSEAFLWQRATQQLEDLEPQGKDALVLWDESVLEKPESIADPDLGSVRSSKAHRLTRIKPGFYHPPGRPIFVPGFQWIGLVLAGMSGTPSGAASTGGPIVESTRATSARRKEHCWSRRSMPGGGGCVTSLTGVSPAPRGSGCSVPRKRRRHRSVTYSTYLGGRRADQSSGVVVDAKGHLFLTGTTNSANFPVIHAIQNHLRVGSCLDPSTAKPSPCTDAFVTEVRVTGRRLIHSTFLGGSNDDAGHSLALDRLGNVYVGGMTNSLNFPLRHALQPSFGGGTCDHGFGELPCSDAFLVELVASGRNLVDSTNLGGPADDAANGVAVNKAGSAYAIGYTWSPTFPASTTKLAGPRPTPHTFVVHSVYG